MATQREIAEACGMSEGRISQIFSEPSGATIGKNAARAFERLTGIPWTQFFMMRTESIKKALFEAIDARKL